MLLERTDDTGIWVSNEQSTPKYEEDNVKPLILKLNTIVKYK